MDVLSQILQTLKVQGSLYFCTAFSPPWGVVVPRHVGVARFHLVTRGACWVRVEGVAQPIQLGKGDLIVVPNGAEHQLLDDLGTAPSTLDDVVRQSGFTGAGALVWGALPTEQPTCMICGHFTFHPERGALMHESMSPFIHVPSDSTPGYARLHEVIDFIAQEATAKEPGGEAVVSRLSEIILIRAIRHLLTTSGRAKRLIKALADEQLRQALEAFHREPGRVWTVGDLARAAAMSRTLFTERMREVLGMSPMEYVTRWRMLIAHEALTSRRESVPLIAGEVGYQSVAAFGRAFKKVFGRAPGQVRKSG